MKNKKGIRKISGFLVIIIILLVSMVSYQGSKALPQDGLVNHWKLDGDAKDSVGALNGEVVGAVPSSGLFGQAYRFDGNGDYIKLGSYQAEEKKYSVSAWFKTDYTGRQDIFQRGQSANCFYNPSIVVSDGGLFASESSCESNGRIGGRYFPGIPIKLGEWNNIVLTRDGDAVKLYLNGYLQVTDTIQPGSPSKNNEKIVIGAIWHSNYQEYINSFNGLIDEVAIWSRALSDSEIESIYKQAFPSAQPPAKLDIEYQSIETFPKEKSQFSDKYAGDSSWTVQQGSWVVENGNLKSVNGPSDIGGDIIFLDGHESSPGKSFRAKVKQSDNWKYSQLLFGYQNKDNTYNIVFDTTNKRIDIRRRVDGQVDSIGLEVDLQKDAWYDVEVRWVSPTEIQVEVWDATGKSLGTLTRDGQLNFMTSKNWTTGKFGLGGVRDFKATSFDDIRIGTIKGLVEPSPTPTPTPSTPPTQKSQFKSPLKSNSLDNVIVIYNIDANFLLDIVKTQYHELDRQDKKFLIDLYEKILERSIQKENGVDDKLAEMLVEAFNKEADEDIQTDIVKSVGIIKSQNSINLLFNLLNSKLLGRCRSATLESALGIPPDPSLDSDPTDDVIKLGGESQQIMQKGPRPSGVLVTESESITEDLLTGAVDIYLDSTIINNKDSEVNVRLYSPANKTYYFAGAGNYNILSRKLFQQDGYLKIKERIRLRRSANGYGIEAYDSDNKLIQCMECQTNRLNPVFSYRLPIYVLTFYSGADNQNFELQSNINTSKFASLQQAEDQEPPAQYAEKVCNKAEEAALKIGSSDFLQLLDLIKFVRETSQSEVLVESLNICNNKDSACQTSQSALDGYIVEAKIKNLGPDRQFHTTTKVLDSVGGQLLARSTKGGDGPQKIELNAGESKWISLTDNVFTKNTGDSVNVKLEIRDYFGYKNIISGAHKVGEKADFGIPQKYNITSYGISLVGSDKNILENNRIIPISEVDGSIYLESSSNNEINRNKITSIGIGNGIVLTDGSPSSDNNKLNSNAVDVVGKASDAVSLIGSQHITMANDTLFSSDSSDLKVSRSKDIKLIDVTIRENKIKFDKDSELEIRESLNIVAKDAETGLNIKNVHIKIKNSKDKREILSERLAEGEKKGVEISRKKFRTTTSKSAFALSSSIRLSSYTEGPDSVEEEEFNYIATAEAAGYKNGSAIINQNTPKYVEISLAKEEAKTEDPVDQVPPPPPAAATASSSSPPSSAPASSQGGATQTQYNDATIPSAGTVENKQTEEESGIQIDRETIFINSAENKKTVVDEKIKIKNTGSSKLTLYISTQSLQQLSIQGTLELASGEEKTVSLTGEIENLKSGIYPGKIILKSADNQISKEISVVVKVDTSEHLFDLLLDVATKKGVLFTGEEIPVVAKIINVAGGKFDVKLEYRLKDFSNKEIFKLEDPVSGDSTVELLKLIKTEKTLPAGNYIIEALLKNKNNENIAVAAVTVYLNGGKIILKQHQEAAETPVGIILAIIIVVAAALIVAAIRGKLVKS